MDLAESSLAVADALRNAVEANGIPALIYVDNGSGYKNAFMQDEATGLVGRIGSDDDAFAAIQPRRRAASSSARTRRWGCKAPSSCRHTSAQ